MSTSTEKTMASPTVCNLSDFRAAPGAVRRDCIMGNMILHTESDGSEASLLSLGFNPGEIADHAPCARIIAARGGAAWTKRADQ